MRKTPVVFVAATITLLTAAPVWSADATTAPEARPAAGPVGPNTPPARWGACVFDEHNKEWLWFGGAGGLSKTGGLDTWVFKDSVWSWRQLGNEHPLVLVGDVADPKDAPKNPPHSMAYYREGIVRGLYAAVANRYYRCENESERKVDLAAKFKELAELCRRDTAVATTDPARQFSDQLQREAADLATRLAAGPPTEKEIASARQLWVTAVRLTWSLTPEPPRRCYPSMAYDARTKKIVLFGGEGIHGVYNDTWLYDCQTRAWSNPRPRLAPPPRLAAGIAARDGKVYIVGGFETRGSMSYCAGLWARLPADVWCYDIPANAWARIAAGEGASQPTTMQPPVQATVSGDGTTLTWTADVTSYGKKVKELSGSIELPGADVETAKHAVSPDAIQVRGEGFDPAWYEDVPPADPEAFARFLTDLPANKWVNVNPPKRHVMRDWGTTVLDAGRDQLLHWAGGHSSHCGTDVAHYSPATNRWHILYTPELPFESCYSNDGAPAPTMTGRPWAPHTYLSYAWDEITWQMIWTGHHGAYRLTNPGGVWQYDPALYEWSWPAWKMEGGTFDPERHKTCMVRTPHGVAVWADKYGGSGLRTGLWLADVNGRTFKPVAGTDPKDSTTLPPPAFGDRHGIAYDAKRDRVLIFHFGIKDKHRIWAVDLKTKAVAVLEPKNSDQFPADVSMGREATYLPDDDAVLLVTPVGKSPQKTLLYDCAADAWLELGGAFAVGKNDRPDPGYGVSTGVEWDAKRKLLWLVQTDGSVYAMRFERKSADLKPVGGG